jgi:hypothetical protein
VAFFIVTVVLLSPLFIKFGNGNLTPVIIFLGKGVTVCAAAAVSDDEVDDVEVLVVMFVSVLIDLLLVVSMVLLMLVLSVELITFVELSVCVCVSGMLDDVANDEPRLA